VAKSIGLAERLNAKLKPDLATKAISKTAITNGSQSLSYAELFIQVDSLANWLDQQKITTLALHGDNSIDWIIVDLACQQAQIKCIPLPSFFSQSQLDNCIQESMIELLLSDSSDLVNRVRSQNPKTTEVDTPIAYPAIRLYPTIELDDAGTPISKCPLDTQKITFTSGSTGSPKGVCLSTEHQWLTARTLADTIDISEPQHLCLLPFATLLENIAGIYAPLLSGGTVIVPSDHDRGLSGSSGLDIAQFLKCISEHQPTTLILIPQLLTALVTACNQGWKPPSSLKFIAVGGAKVSPELLAQAASLGLPVFEGYGLSECGSVLALNTPKAFKAGCVGKVLAHCKLSVTNGHIFVTEPIFFGYFDDPQSWYPKAVATGDLGELNDGYLSVFGRSKNLLITSFGRNISPEWLESELMAQPLLSQCVVIGDSRPFLSALLSATPAVSDTQIEAWIASVNLSLPDYAQVKKWLRLSDSQWNGYLTANGRPQRENINRDFDALIKGLYQQQSNNRKLVTMSTSNQTFFARLQTETEQARNHLLSAPIINRCMTGDITLHDYGAFLLQAYHHVKHTTPLLMAAGARMPASKEWLREALAEYIEEELGHQEWILNDIEKCGFDKEAARQSTPNAATELMVAYAYDTINRINPVGFFGMVHVLEGTSVNMADQAADSIQRALGLPQDTFSYLRSHGALDQEHVKFFEDVVNRIDDIQDQNQIIHCANMFYQLYGNVFRELDEAQAQQIAA